MLMGIAVLSGIIYSFIQLVYNRGLWSDEISLALNIINKSWSDLLMPLDYAQVAPIGFLFIEKTFLVLFGGTSLGANDFALRIIPFISFLACLPLIYILANRLTSSNEIASLSTAFYALNPTAIYYASEVKQYASDTLIGLIIINLYFYFDPKSNRSILLMSLVGSVAIWLSNIAIIILFTLSLVILVENRKFLRGLIPLLSWAITFLVYYYFFIHEHPTSEYMRDFWQGNFLPTNPLTSEFWFFIKKYVLIEIVNLTKIGVIYPLIALTTLIGLFYQLIQGKYKALFILLFPLLTHLALSSFEMYPFARRLILFHLPLIILLICCTSFTFFSTINKKYVDLLIMIFLIPVVSLFWFNYEAIPTEVSHMRPLISKLDDQISSDDFVRAYSRARSHFTYYRNHFSKLQTASIELIDVTKTPVDAEIEEIISLNKTGWLAFRHWKGQINNLEYEKSILSKLEALKYNISMVYEANNARLYRIQRKSIFQDDLEN